VIEALFTRMSIKDALNNGHSMSDEAVISRIAMAAVAMLMMLSMILYVKCANKPVLYDRLMIGGSVVMALVMRALKGICGGENMNEYVRMKMRLINVVMVVMSLVMAIESLVAVINSRNNNRNNIDRKDENESNDASKNASGIAKNVIVVVSTFVMVITGWVIKRMGVDVDVSNEMQQ